MPITTAEITFRLSGGAANSDPNAALGGAKSSVAITDATVANLFDNVSGAESTAGDTEYRCFYVNNGNGSLTWQNVRVFIQTNTPSAGSDIAIAAAGEGVNGTAETVGNESTAPTGESFTQPTDYAGGISLGNIPAGQHHAVWVRRVITAAAAAVNADSAVIRVQGETAA